MNFNDQSNDYENAHNGHDSQNQSEKGPPHIPERIFIEKNPSSEAKIATNSYISAANLNTLLNFLDENYEEIGYKDALKNPDSHHMDQNVKELMNKISRLICRVKMYYEDLISEIDLHIDTRSRCGMIDTVEELKMKKEIAKNHIKKVLEIEDESSSVGLESQGIILSYIKGFKNGLAAISLHTILNRNL